METETAVYEGAWDEMRGSQCILEGAVVAICQSLERTFGSCVICKSRSASASRCVVCVVLVQYILLYIMCRPGIEASG